MLSTSAASDGLEATVVELVEAGGRAPLNEVTSDECLIAAARIILMGERDHRKQLQRTIAAPARRSIW